MHDKNDEKLSKCFKNIRIYSSQYLGERKDYYF